MTAAGRGQAPDSGAPIDRPIPGAPACYATVIAQPTIGPTRRDFLCYLHGDFSPRTF